MTQSEGQVTAVELAKLIQHISRLPALPSTFQARLQETKGTKPWLMCLDMKDWVWLSKAYYGKPQPGASEALEQLTAAVESRSVVVPISSVNLIEVSEIGNDERRKKLAHFMVELARNHTLIDHELVCEHELGTALSRNYLGREPTLMLRSELLRWGIIWASGVHALPDVVGSPNDQLLRHEAMLHPMISARALGSLTTRQETVEGLDLDQRYKMLDEILRKETASLSEQQRWEFESGHTLLHGPVAERLKRAANALGLNWTAVAAWLESDAVRAEFMQSVPSLAVNFRLRATRNRNHQHATDENDLKDLLFLSAVIPYADIVVTEKSWGSVAKAGKLGERYNTRICLNVPEGLRTLAGLGSS